LITRVTQSVAPASSGGGGSGSSGNGGSGGDSSGGSFRGYLGSQFLRYSVDQPLWLSEILPLSEQRGWRCDRRADRVLGWIRRPSQFWKCVSISPWDSFNLRRDRGVSSCLAHRLRPLLDPSPFAVLERCFTLPMVLDWQVGACLSRLAHDLHQTRRSSQFWKGFSLSPRNSLCRFGVLQPSSVRTSSRSAALCSSAQGPASLAGLVSRSVPGLA
jgi:hypothetical protein